MTKMAALDIKPMNFSQWIREKGRAQNPSERYQEEKEKIANK